MATLYGLVDRVRMELGDAGKSFVWGIDATGTNRYELPYSPVDASTIVVTVDGADVSADCEVEETTGVLTLDDTPSVGDPIAVQGTYFRYFTNSELGAIVEAAVAEHLHHRQDAFGRQLNITNLPAVEEYPAALLGTIQALYTLATDAAFDIDIHTPDGISIPRSERYRQLMDLIASRREQYNTLCEALNIGLTRIEVLQYRRISRATNRYVPIYVPQEIDDRTPRQRVYLPITTYGAEAAPATSIQVDLVFTQGDDFSYDLDFPVDLSLYTIKAQARLYPESAAVIGEFTVAVDPSDSHKATISLSSDLTEKFPLRCFWDLQLIGPTPTDKEFTYFSGAVFAKRQITHD